MTVIHATDPTTQVLSLLYQQREDVKLCITERNTSSDVQRALRADDVIMMLRHGNEYGLFSKPDKNGDYRRFLIADRHVQFLRDKTCIGIWCYANKFAELRPSFVKGKELIDDIAMALDKTAEAVESTDTQIANQFSM